MRISIGSIEQLYRISWGRSIAGLRVWDRESTDRRPGSSFLGVLDRVVFFGEKRQLRENSGHVRYGRVWAF